MSDYTYIGLVAAFCTTVAFFPQVWQVFKTGNVDGISIPMYSIFTVGVAFWLLYGVVLKDPPMIIANVITLVLAGTVLLLVVKKRVWDKRPR